jgi:two-component system LytT family sensor kinase
MLKNRSFLHIGFWILYFSITFFNELFLTSDYIDGLSADQLVRTFASELIILALKIGITYFTLYYLIPRSLKSKNKFFNTLLIVVFLILFTFIYRLVIQFVTWPYFLKYIPELTLQSYLARFFYSFLEIFQLLGVTTAIKLLRLRAQMAEQEKEALHEKMNSDLLRLKAQIHPHFLFNMLNNLYSMSRTNSPMTSEVIYKMSDLLRYMLYESEKKLVPLESEIRILKEYIVIQDVRFHNKLKVDFQVNADDQQVSITPLLIFPLIENAFKHGAGLRSEHPFIEMSITVRQNILEVRTRNSIAEHSVKSNGEGIGQANIKKQLNILYKDHTFEYCKKDEEYFVYLKINLNSYVDFELFDH